MCGACGRWSLDSVQKKSSLRMIVVNELLSFAVNDFSAKSLFVVTGHLLYKTLIGRASCTLEMEIEICV